uniref:FLYWCH-type domain-containing protein n=1 Tax=Ditylenchus dipsaci TaxID=166011 RepID=A0A915DUW6_9BILA
MEILRSEKGKDIGHLNDFLYWKQSSKGAKAYWRCIFFQAGPDGEETTKCPGRAISTNSDAYNSKKHNHVGDKSRVDLKRMQGYVQEKSVSSKEPPRKILAEAIERTDEDSQPLIRRSLVTRNIRNHRHTARVEPANPQMLIDLKIPEAYQMCGKEVFLKYDGWNNDERILIFATDKCLDMLVSINKWGCDGTFDVVPLLFDQLWIIFVRLAYSYVPAVFVLMNRRLESSYLFVLAKLQELRPKMSPSSVALDFEKAEWNAFEKSVVRSVSTNGSKELYDSSDDFRREVNLILATAFIPSSNVSNAFTKLRHYLEDSVFADQLEPILDYFEDCYLGRPNGDKRRKPRYPIEKWNVVDRVITDEPRTSNSIESFNGQLIRTLAASHPTIWKLIDDTGLFSKIERISEGIFLCIREDGSTVYRKSIEVVGEKEGPSILFNPLSREQQIKQCEKYGLDFKHSLKYMFSKKKFFQTTGRPIKTQVILETETAAFGLLAIVFSEQKNTTSFNFLDTNDPIEKHIENILIPAKNSLETHKYCQNVDFAAAAKDFGFNVLLFSDIGCSIYSPALDESLIVTQDVSLSSLPIVFTGGNHFEVALNVSAKMEEG